MKRIPVQIARYGDGLIHIQAKGKEVNRPYGAAVTVKTTDSYGSLEKVEHNLPSLAGTERLYTPAIFRRHAVDEDLIVIADRSGASHYFRFEVPASQVKELVALLEQVEEQEEAPVAEAAAPYSENAYEGEAEVVEAENNGSFVEAQVRVRDDGTLHVQAIGKGGNRPYGHSSNIDLPGELASLVRQLPAVKESLAGTGRKYAEASVGVKDDHIGFTFDVGGIECAFCVREEAEKSLAEFVRSN